MRILPLKTIPMSFGKKFDLGEELNNAFNKNNGDSFTPYSPSQPIIIEKLEINQKNDSDSLSKKGKASGLAGGTVAGIGISEAKDYITDKTDKKDIDINKLIDETAEEHSSENNAEDISIADVDLDQNEHTDSDNEEITENIDEE